MVKIVDYEELMKKDNDSYMKTIIQLICENAKTVINYLVKICIKDVKAKLQLENPQGYYQQRNKNYQHLDEFLKQQNMGIVLKHYLQYVSFDNKREWFLISLEKLKQQ